jgi:hypothetical protein
MTAQTRLRRIEKQLGVRQDDETIELRLPGGRIARTTRRAFDGFVAWLKEREHYGQETIETD